MGEEHENAVIERLEKTYGTPIQNILLLTGF